MSHAAVEFPADAPAALHRIEQAGAQGAPRPAGIQRLYLGSPANPIFGQVTFIPWEEWKKMVQQDAYKIVERFIQHERQMRERVFAQKPNLLADKLRDCDRALEALAVLAPAPGDEAEQAQAAAEQAELFGEEPCADS